MINSNTITVVLLIILIVPLAYRVGGRYYVTSILKNDGEVLSRTTPFPYNEVEIKSNKVKYIKDEKSFFNLSPIAKDGSDIHPYNTLKI